SAQRDLQGCAGAAAGASSTFQISRCSFQPPAVRCHTSRYLPVTAAPCGSVVLQLPVRHTQSPPPPPPSEVILIGAPLPAMSLAQYSRIAAEPLTTGGPGGRSCPSSL